MLGVFRYSHEAGTPAATMDTDPDLHVPDAVKREREEEIMLTQQRISFANAKFVAEQRSQFDVLIDDRAASGAKSIDTPGVGTAGTLHVGRCYHQAPQVDSLTYVHSADELSPGELVRCTIVDADGYDLVAQPTEELERVMRLPVIP